MLRTALTLTVFASVAAISVSLSAQDPGRDLPHVREVGVPAEQRVAQITKRLVAGWDWEAARLCREMIVADDKAPLPRMLLALAMRHEPNRAARECWEAVRRKGNASPAVQKVVDALRRYHGVESQPEIVDERFAAVPPTARHDRYARELREIADARDGERALLQGLLRIARARRAEVQMGDEDVEPVLRRHNAYLQGMGAMPFEIPGYVDLVKRYVEGDAERARQLARLPRHPDYVPRRLVGPLPGLQQVGEDLWRPNQASKLTLPSGYGGNVTFDPTAGQPTLVVFFLGFGCAHCVAQLKDLDPQTPKFRAAGIEVVSIGTDALNQVKAAQQAALENGVDPLHFDVLCDPKGDVFKQWNVWDEFSGEALHGTFLVDGKGRILWQDISERPFEASDWLLAECQRLLAAWR